MIKISLDNPILVKIAFLLFGLIGFVIVQISTNSLNLFSLEFVILSFIELIFFIYIAIVLEKKINWKIKKINPFFGLMAIIVKIYLLILLIDHGSVGNFNNRLSVYGNSFLLGVSLVVGFVLFPILPLYGYNNFIKKTSLIIWIIGILISLILAPSKSIIIAIISSLLFYRFLKRKSINMNLKPISIFSFKSIAVFIVTVTGTFAFIYFKVGSEGISLIIHRIAYNFDMAIYASKLPETLYPEHSNLFYALLPILKKLNSSFYGLKYFSIPQWIIGEYFGYSRYGRFGYPNDNFIVGLLVSYKEYGIFLFFVFLYIFYKYVNFFKKLTRIGLINLFLIFSIPTAFSSLQGTAIRFYTIFFLYMITYYIYIILLKKTKINKKFLNSNNL